MRTSLLVTTLIASLSLGSLAGALGASAGCKKAQDKPAIPQEPAPTTPAAPATVDAPAKADTPMPPPDAAAAPAADAAKAAADPLKSICPQVLAKIVECSEDKEFEKALKEGADAKEQKKISKLIAGIAEWPVNPCNNLAASYEFEGFIEQWDKLADPAILESCGKLGAAVKAAGGLFGGDAAM